MFDMIEPVDTCGCGDTGYLTTRTVPIDVAHGVGEISEVPVYHCRTEGCTEYTLPAAVSRRLETIAEEMEETQALQAVFSWSSANEEAPANNSQQTLLEAFLLTLKDRSYEDAKVILAVPGGGIFLQSRLEESEFYRLQVDDQTPENQGVWFILSKFYFDEPNLTYEKFLEWSEDGYLKEIGRIPLEEAEDVLRDEFGDWTVG